MSVIGICGFIGSGKDTVAQYLCDSRDYTRLSMASALKDATAVLFGWDRDMLEGKTAENRKLREEPDQFWAERLGIPNFSPRYALQFLGTDLFRNNLHQDTWVIATERRIAQHKKVVISDIRFPNEIDMIRRHGGEVWRVRRGPEPDWALCASINAHAIENDANPNNMPAQWILQDRGELMEQKYPEVHYSEWAWINTKFDLTLYNDSTLASLYSTVEAYMQIKP